MPLTPGGPVDTELLAYLVRQYGGHDLTMYGPPRRAPRTRWQAERYARRAAADWQAHAARFAAIADGGVMPGPRPVTVATPWQAARFAHVATGETGQRQVHTHWLVLIDGDAELAERIAAQRPGPYIPPGRDGTDYGRARRDADLADLPPQYRERIARGRDAAELAAAAHDLSYAATSERTARSMTAAG